MKLADLDPVFNPRLEVSDKDAALRAIAAQLLAPHRPSRDLIESFYQRFWLGERLNSTAIGEGIPIPHAKLDGIPTVLCGCFVLRPPLVVGPQPRMRSHAGDTLTTAANAAPTAVRCR
jgi:hypothetical protein